MELVLGYELLESYKRLPYKAWYALAEFIDNSTQSYRNHQEEMLQQYENEDDMLRVSIAYKNGKTEGYLIIKDNAYGMSEDVLRKALILGRRPDNRSERSKYGMGLKTAAFWFGDAWEVSTTELGSGTKYTISIDLQAILLEEQKFNDKRDQAEKEGSTEQLGLFKPTIHVSTSSCESSEHGTTITITKLNQTFTAAKATSCKEYLGSIYRRDIEYKTLNLLFQNEEVDYIKETLMSRVLVDGDGKNFLRHFEFDVNGKTVKGWAAVLKSGSRNWGGFALIQADRVIQGWPSNYKPTELFGDQEGGTNNLVNQRLIGELDLDGFEVSHTKDTIIFTDDDEKILNDKLLVEIADYKKIAADFRLKEIVKQETEFDFGNAVNDVLGYVATTKFQDIIFNKQVLPLEVIEKTTDEAVARILNKEPEIINYEINNIKVKVIMSDESSPFDPYLIVKLKSDRDNLTIVINKNHTYWAELSTQEAIYSFITSCIYDGLSEWKAYYIVGDMSPDTIKMIKDSFLRMSLKYK